MKKFSLLLLLTLLLFACRDEQDITTPPMGPDPQIIVNASVHGLVIDGNSNPVDGAMIVFNNKEYRTDENGIFAMTNEQLFEDGTYVQVFKEGYFHGSRTFYPTVNELNHIVIRLIEKISVGNLNTADGGLIEFEDVEISFPKDAFVRENGNEYSGNVNVFAKYLDPTKSETLEEMPGDLVGVNLDDDLRALVSYGMIGVELEDNQGNPLQIKEGQTAEIRLPVPTLLLSSAPSEIPLWHFDEASGYWIEEGKAQLINGVYIGDVRHFSYWNCDAPFPLIHLEGTILINGLGLENVKVEIVDNASGTARCGYTSNRGMFGGKMPQDASLTLNVYDDCGNVIHSEQIGPFASDTTLPAININSSLNVATVSGSIENCNGDDFEQSYIIVNFDNGTTRTFAATAGNFQFTLINCTSNSATVFGVDVTNQLISEGVVVQLTGDVSLGALTACDEYITSKLFIDYVGSPWNNPSAQDTVAMAYSEQIFPNLKTIYTITVIDWVSQDVGEIVVVLDDGATVANYNASFSGDGFDCAGVDAESGIILSQTGEEFLILKDTTTDITVTDSNLFDPGITEVEFDIVLKL